MNRGDRVTEIATGRTATVVLVQPNGTADQTQPWAKIMFGLGEQGVSFACRLISELKPEAPDPANDPEYQRFLAAFRGPRGKSISR